MPETPEDYELFHYGVKGMKWGVRRDRESKGLVVKKAPKPIPKDSEKSAHRVRLEAKYMSKGYSQMDAETKANGRIKAEKVLLAVGATAATVAVAYGASVAYDKRFNSVELDVGSVLKNINALGKDQDYDRRLYTTIKEGDTKKYRGLLAQTLRKNQPNTTIYETTLKATEKIKAPSHSQASKLYKEYRKAQIAGAQSPLDKQLAEMSYPSSYKIFNRNLVADVGSDSFYSFMKNKGYNAILDSNDQFISGYNAKKPLILFNAKSSIVKAGEKVVSEELSSKLANRQTASIAGVMAAKSVGLGLAYIGGKRALDTKIRHGAVNQYFKEHPDSTMSYAEVYSRMKTDRSGRYVYSTKASSKTARREA